MPPKKTEGEAALFAEAEKGMYEYQIADLERKLNRLKNVCQDFEFRNKELKIDTQRLDEEKAEAIASLKRTIASKNDENNELKDKIKNINKMRAEEGIIFNERVKDLQDTFTSTKNRLSSENKLLTSKLNALDEFRATRQELMDKYSRQEQEMADQEMKYKRVVYDAEAKFLIDKENLTKEMEIRLLKLAQDFQDDSETRITTSTHRVIRENIALNNLMGNLLYTKAKVQEENHKLKSNEIAARKAMNAAEILRDVEINKNVVQLKVMQQLKQAYRDMQEKIAMQSRRELNFKKIESRFCLLSKENEEIISKMRLLEQKLHACFGEQTKQRIETAKIFRERDHFRKIIKNTVITIQANLKTDKWAEIDSEREIIDRATIFRNILKVVTKYLFPVQSESTVSLISFGGVYETGDLGFVPKPQVYVEKRKAADRESASEVLEEEQSSSAISSSSIVTLKTMPSLLVMPAVEDVVSAITKGSPPSFTVTSAHSSIGAGPESESQEELDELGKLLEKSKMEIQKSILKDLAMVSTAGLSSKSRLDFRQSVARMSVDTNEAKEMGDKDNNEKDVSTVDQTDGTSQPSEIAEGEETETVNEKTEKE